MWWLPGSGSLAAAAAPAVCGGCKQPKHFDLILIFFDIFMNTSSNPTALSVKNFSRVVFSFHVLLP
jgi:hypothetical protein